jgi:transposase-like protein
MNVMVLQDIHIQHLIDDAKCFETVRDLRWGDGILCPHCCWDLIIKRGFDETQPHRQRYCCRSCDRGFDDLTDTIFAGHHQPLRVWILCLYFMGLNRSNRQIAQELDLNKDDVQQMTKQLRHGIVQHKAPVRLEGEVECDEVYLAAGHKGHPEAVKKRTDWPTKPTQRPPRTRNLSPRETADFRHDSTSRRGVDSDAGECPAENH